jgi:ATP-dependent DNA ligase
MMIPHIWVEPELLAEIEYRAKSAEGKVRHPFLRGAAGEFVMKEKDPFDLWWEWPTKCPKAC